MPVHGGDQGPCALVAAGQSIPGGVVGGEGPAAVLALPTVELRQPAFVRRGAAVFVAVVLPGRRELGQQSLQVRQAQGLQCGGSGFAHRAGMGQQQVLGGGWGRGFGQGEGGRVESGGIGAAAEPGGAIIRLG